MHARKAAGYKQRWVYIPEGRKASFRKDKVFDFPVGSALIKTFYYPIDERNLSLGKKLMETRLLLRKQNGWEAVSYAWNENQDEAIIKKYNQLMQLGFKNVYIYPGGLFEWLLLQDIYGDDMFKTTNNVIDILKYK